MSGSEDMGELRVRIRVLWSKLHYFQSQIIIAEDKLSMANKESDEVARYLNLLDQPFGLITYGEIENIMNNDILEVPKEKEEIVQKQRMSILPQSGLTNKLTSNTYADKIDQALRGTLSKIFF